MSDKSAVIETLPLRFVNAYLMRGQRHILVDTGFPGMAEPLLKQIEQRGVALRDISLIVITHGHPDHAGSAADLQNRLGIPVAIHLADAPWMRSGHTYIPRPIRPFGYFIKAITKTTIAPFEPDLLLEDGMELGDYGIDGRIVHTPGHSPGSISIVEAAGGIIVGDLMAGSQFRANRPAYHYLAEDVPLVEQSIERLLNLPGQEFYFGHGLPSGAEQVRARFAQK